MRKYSQLPQFGLINAASFIFGGLFRELRRVKDSAWVETRNFFWRFHGHWPRRVKVKATRMASPVSINRGEISKNVLPLFLSLFFSCPFSRACFSTVPPPPTLVRCVGSTFTLPGLTTTTTIVYSSVESEAEPWALSLARVSFFFFFFSAEWKNNQG